jgi:hypothetical protein
MLDLRESLCGAGWEEEPVTLPRMGVAERRARLVSRQGLALSARGGDVDSAARSVVALHATDPATVFLAVRARTAGVDPDDIQRAFLDERSVVRWVGWRRTLFAVPRDLLPDLQASTTRTIADRAQRSLGAVLSGSGVTDQPDRWLEAAAEAVVTALAGRAEASTGELIDAVPALAARVRTAVGTRWERSHRAGTLVLPVLAMHGLLVRTRPRGSWLSPQFYWSTTQSWLGGPVDRVDPGTARACVLARWLRAFGPGTEADLRWWTGWPLREIRAALAAVPHAEVDLDGTTGYVLTDDLGPTPAPEPAAALLPTLDPTTMGWRNREWYLGPHGDRLIDSAGNAGPTVWWAGQVVGGWAQGQDGQIVTGLLEDVGTDAERAITAEAQRVRSWLGDARLPSGVLPPYQRSLVA